MVSKSRERGRENDSINGVKSDWEKFVNSHHNNVFYF
jgi:hypothetical protein